MNVKEQNVSIQIDTLREDSGIRERDRKIFEGSRHELKEKIYLRYKEVLAEGEDAVSSMLVIDGNDLKLHRKGAFGGDMNFRLGKKTDVSYVTPMGTVPMQIYTSGLDLFISDKRIEINLGYTLYSGGSDGISTSMRIVAEG